MIKLGTIVILCSMAIAMPVFCCIAGDPKELEQWFHDLTTKTDQKVTKLHFYLQDLRGITTTIVAQSNTSLTSPTFFGLTYMVDDPLTVGPSQASKVVGRAQGLYGLSSKEDMRLFMAIDIVFTDGTYNGSALTVLGSNPLTQTKRELPVIGGTGVFRLARGVALLNTYFFNAALGNATVEYTVIVQHY
ncbi:Dirigent protein 23 [Camellia lanceoleosa]|uniref:Dirigent protein 23 n=2 Tax=Camellia lanceoleosa TaxID=1840588 RepID=A0ACC0IPB9_9ERIC|nr:Dirigent protein 23 [Camellia lanceoleosa]